MDFSGKLFGKKEPDPVLVLLGALRDENEGVRLQAVSALGQIGAPRSLGPLLYALQDQSQAVRAAAEACLAHAGVEEGEAERISVVYDEKTPWEKGFGDWIKEVKRMSLFGGLQPGIVGFLFNDEHKALRAALDTKRQATVFIWSNKSMIKYEFGFSNAEAIKVARRMRGRGATEVIPASCDASLTRQLQAIFTQIGAL
jgi:hypothetical protein